MGELYLLQNVSKMVRSVRCSQYLKFTILYELKCIQSKIKRQKLFTTVAYCRTLQELERTSSPILPTESKQTKTVRSVRCSQCLKFTIHYQLKYLQSKIKRQKLFTTVAYCRTLQELERMSSPILSTESEQPT